MSLLKSIEVLNHELKEKIKKHQEVQKRKSSTAAERKAANIVIAELKQVRGKINDLRKAESQRRRPSKSREASVECE